jgi:hypothetical protein
MEIEESSEPKASGYQILFEWKVDEQSKEKEYIQIELQV